MKRKHEAQLDLGKTAERGHGSQTAADLVLSCHKTPRSTSAVSKTAQSCRQKA